MKRASITKTSTEKLLKGMERTKMDAEIEAFDKHRTLFRSNADLKTLIKTIEECDNSIAKAKKFLDN